MYGKKNVPNTLYLSSKWSNFPLKRVIKFLISILISVNTSIYPLPQYHNLYSLVKSLIFFKTTLKAFLHSTYTLKHNVLGTTRDNKAVVLVLLTTGNSEFQKNNLFWSHSYHKTPSCLSISIATRTRQKGHVSSSSNRKVYKNCSYQILVHARYVNVQLPVEVHAFCVMWHEQVILL
jgi:hypothetical protein